MDEMKDTLDTSGMEYKTLGVVSRSHDLVTKEMLIDYFPEKSKTITDELVDLINDAQLDPQFDVLTMFNQMISYKDVMTKSEMANGMTRLYQWAQEHNIKLPNNDYDDLL